MDKFSYINSSLDKDVIIEFINWDNCVSKSNYDLMYSYSIEEKKNDFRILNFIFLRDGPELVKIIYASENIFCFFSYLDNVVYLRYVDEVSNLDLFNGGKDGIKKYLKTTKPQINHLPANRPYNPGMLGISDDSPFCLAYSSLMQRMMLVNLCYSQSRFYDANFHNELKNILPLQSTNSQLYINEIIKNYPYQLKNLYLKERFWKKICLF